LDEKKKYKISTCDYPGIEGGACYSLLKDARVLIPGEKGQIDYDVLQTAIARKKAIAPKVDGRIKRLDKEQKQQTDCN